MPDFSHLAVAGSLLDAVEAVHADIVDLTPPHTHARTHHSNYPPRRFNFFMPRVLQVAGWLAAAGYLLDKRSNPN